MTLWIDFATREPKTRMASLRMAFGLPEATSVRVWDWPGVRLVDTTADAVTGVTALTLWPVAMATTSAGAAVAGTALCWVWTTWAVAVPAVCLSKQIFNTHKQDRMVQVSWKAISQQNNRSNWIYFVFYTFNADFMSHCRHCCDKSNQLLIYISV